MLPYYPLGVYKDCQDAQAGKADDKEKGTEQSADEAADQSQTAEKVGERANG
jgi:hypothetical protein